MTTIDRAGCPGNEWTGHHGTATDYQKGCRCDDAREATRIYRKRLREGRHPSQLVDATGTVRRVRALYAIGWTGRDIAARLSKGTRSLSNLRGTNPLVTRATAVRVARVYDQLSMTPGPSQLTRNRARSLGYAPPLAWDDEDIDNPAARPNYGPKLDYRARPEVQQSQIDDVLAGRAPLHSLPKSYRAPIVADLHKAGLTYVAIAQRVRITDRTIVRYLSPGKAA